MNVQARAKGAVIGLVMAIFAAASLAASARAAATVTLDWQPVTTNADGSGITDLAGYRVFYATYSLLSMTTAQVMADPNVHQAVPSIPSATTNTVTLSLLNATTYFFRVTAFDTSANLSDLDQEAVDVTTCTPPAPTAPPVQPTNLRLLSATTGQIVVAWNDNSSNETGFQLQWSLTGTGGWSTVSLPPNTTTYAHTNLPAGTAYFYEVRAVNGVGNPPYTAPLSAQTPPSSVGGLGGVGVPPGLKEAYAYPNPALGVDPVIRAMMGGVDVLEITIFDQAGHAVKSDRVTQAVVVNGQPAYEYKWAGEKGSGIYYAVLHGKKGNETVRARASFAVVK